MEAVFFYRDAAEGHKGRPRNHTGPQRGIRTGRGTGRKHSARTQGGWIFYVSPEGYYADWFAKPYIYVGGALFMAGMAVNLHSDHIIRNLRKPGDTRHYIPRGGMFRYVSSANYFGELLEWTGFAVASWSWAGAVFAWWTFANLAPRAASLYKRYAQEFGKEFTALKRKKIIPFIY